mmetsp:Transcript_9502/g.12437  ORF Transcript_9502/g.12437 Transcript_9502/m.12437 type:complete len:186 (-) Transcript_9502:193-750(-)
MGDADRCSRMKEFALQYCPKVIFMLENIEKLGCTIPKNFISCQSCEVDGISGGFVNSDQTSNESKPQVVVCEDRIFDQQHLNDTIVHELIHAYDACRAHMDPANLRQHACTEIRASNLSGECSWKNEMARGNFGFKLQQQECVKRRAVLSVLGNPNCKSKEEAAKIVQEVFHVCYKDTSPFDRNP